MKYRSLCCSILLAALMAIGGLPLCAQTDSRSLPERFEEPGDEARPWVFWYWMNGAVTPQGITADLEAMKGIGLAGAYLMPIRDSSRVQFMDDCTLQGTEKWWQMVDWSLREADRLGLKMGLHICDGFALAGGPWITPELSMQQVVWSEQTVRGGRNLTVALPQPPARENYYEDIAVFALALPEPVAADINAVNRLPRVTVSTGEAADYLLSDNKDRLKSARPLWIQYAYDEPFTARSLTVTPSGTNFQALRWRVTCSDDGVDFREVKMLVPARRGWQDTDAANTYSLPETTARYFRFYWTPEGTEPGAEDLDAAKWKAELAVRQLTLSPMPLIENFEGKTGQVWRLSARQSGSDLPDDLCFQPSDVLDVTDKFSEGCLRGLTLDPGRSWLLLRVGHTSTGHRNDTGGGAKGLECDKFREEAVRCQFGHWFGETWQHVDQDVLSRTLVRMHSDSWECGSQNWTPRFLEEFLHRRGYDLKPYLPLFAGLPIASAEESESVMYDIRQTISDLTDEVFFGTLHGLAEVHGCEFSSECVAPTMLSDGLRHYGRVDLPMGEYWLDSPTHDKPNDMFDAVSGAHIYGKNIVQAEGFTQLRALWKEYPGMLKTLGDRNLALGMNRLFFHVFCHHPFPGKYPGMTLDGIGLYMQGNQTWWPYASAWVDYFARCQSLLQTGVPVTDVAVFTGEELPSRSLLPDRLVASLPGLFGPERVASEAARVRNEGQPVHKTSVGVTASANMVTADLWNDPLHGYRYDAVNPDVLLRLAKAENGRMVLPGGASYRVLVLPMPHPMAPDTLYMSYGLLQRLEELQLGGVMVLLPPACPEAPISVKTTSADREAFRRLAERVWARAEQNGCLLPFRGESFASQGLPRDLSFADDQGRPMEMFTWNHRRSDQGDMWFVSNQSDEAVCADVCLRGRADLPLQCWDPLSGRRFRLACDVADGLLRFRLPMEAAGSCFLIQDDSPVDELPAWGTPETELPLSKFRYTLSMYGKPGARPDEVAPDTQLPLLAQVSASPSSPRFDSVQWPDSAARYYSGTVRYDASFRCVLPKTARRIWLEFDQVDVVASVRLNGRDCGMVWSKPWRVDVTDALVQGTNRLEIYVANTWYNYSQAVNYGLVQDDRWWTNGRKWDFRENYRLNEADLQPSWLSGGLHLKYETK